MVFFYLNASTPPSGVFSFSFSQHQDGSSAWFRNPNKFYDPSVIVGEWSDETQDDWMADMLCQFYNNVTAFAISKAGGSQSLRPNEVILYPV
jgi:hypothetical protein